MMYEELLGLPAKALRAHGQALEAERNRLDKWSTLAARDDGQWLLGELKETLETIVAYYVAIPINTEFTAALLANNQGREAEVRRFIRKLADSKNLRKDIDSEIEMVLNILNQRESADTEPGSFVPASHKPKGDFNG